MQSQYSSDYIEETIYKELDKNYENIQKLLENLNHNLIRLEPKVCTFEYKKIEKKINENSVLNIKRGRPKKNMNNNNISHIHSKMSFDNICQKIKVLYHHFLINLVNDFIKHSYKGFQKFRVRKISSEITQNVTKSFNLKLAKCNLREFFSNEISNKYKRYSGNKNEENINKLCFTKPIVNEFFNLNYFDVYKDIFIYGKRPELKIKFGVSDITLLFNDCLKKIKEKESEEYINKIDNIAKGKFMSLLEYGKIYNNIYS